jgi:hypothetical protein
MTRLRTILNKYKEMSMAYRTGKPKIRMQETYADFSDEQIADMVKRLNESRNPREPLFTTDMVNHPPHYTQGGMETIDIMEAKSTPEEFKGHLKLTAMKYLTRAGHKESELQDAKKTQWYVNKWVRTIEKHAVKIETFDE